MKKATAKKATAKPVSKVKKAPTPQKNAKYIKVGEKNVRIPKIVLGQHPDIINMYFKIPTEVRLRWKQLILKATDKLTFGPLKGKQFQSILKDTDESIKLFYRDKFLLASKNEEFVRKVADYFNPFASLPEELEIRIENVDNDIN